MFPAQAGMNRYPCRWQRRPVFPATGGVNRGCYDPNRGAGRVPRTGGDEPECRVPVNSAECSPLHRVLTGDEPREVVFPAQAGMNRSGLRLGESASVFPAQAGMNRTPPNPRRIVFPAQAGMNRIRRQGRVFPAQAGMNATSRHA